MTETQFIEENKEHWVELERLLNANQRDPDKLHDLFVKVSSDLAYATTFYPKRSVRAYLNQLTQRVFDSMEKKKTQWSMEPVREFFRNVLPREIYQTRKALLTSFIVFVIAVLIGVISTVNDPDFTRVILGDAYVEMTNKNIDNNDPMAVYKDSEQADMFLQITYNNIRVSFLCFIMGIFGSLGTIIILLHNGIMLGTFQYYFYTKGLFLESFLTIWIHGTIEISAIIIAGAAGIVLGNGLLFPSTYDRGTSLQLAAKRSVTIIIGTVPLFVIAGFLESFITRLTGMPTVLKVLIIGGSLIFILGLYVIYPWWHHRTIDSKNKNSELEPNETKPLKFTKNRFRDLNQNIYLGFAQFRINMAKYFDHGISILMILFIICISFYQWLLSPYAEYSSQTILGSDIDPYVEPQIFLAGYNFGDLPMFFVYWFLATYACLILTMIYREEKLKMLGKLIYLKLHFINMLLVTLIPVVVFYFTHTAWLFLVFLVLPPHFLATLIYKIPEDGWSVWSKWSKYYQVSTSGWGSAIVTFGLTAILHFMVVFAMLELIGTFFIDFISWHDMFSGYNVTNVILRTTIAVFFFLVMLPLYYYLFVNQMNSEFSKTNATDLWDRYDKFNNQSNIFESKS